MKGFINKLDGVVPLVADKPNAKWTTCIDTDFWITPMKSGFNTVRLTQRFTRICSE